MPGGHYRGPTSVGPPARGLGPCGGCRTREGNVPARTVPSGSPAQAEALDERPVPVCVGLGQVVQQPATTTDQQEQPPPAVVVVLVLLEVLGQVADPAGQHRDLHLGRTGVLVDRGVLGHDLLLRRAVERHGSPPEAGHVWPPVSVTEAGCTQVGSTDHRSGYPTACRPPDDTAARSRPRPPLSRCPCPRREVSGPTPGHRGQEPSPAAAEPLPMPRAGAPAPHPGPPRGQGPPRGASPRRSWVRPTASSRGDSED